MTDQGTVYPPRDKWDIAGYSTDDVVAGYSEHRLDDPTPGPNNSPGYRWGWANARKDATKQPDGFEAMRSAFIRLEREMQ